MRVTLTHLKTSPRPWPYHTPGAVHRLKPGESAEITDAYAREYGHPNARRFGEWITEQGNRGMPKPRLSLSTTEDAAPSDAPPADDTKTGTQPAQKPATRGKEQ